MEGGSRRRQTAPHAEHRQARAEGGPRGHLPDPDGLGRSAAPRPRHRRWRRHGWMGEPHMARPPRRNGRPRRQLRGHSVHQPVRL
ncbi:uncharacterized protein METZ01_LOCUS469405, partial [marine metagenome]